MKSDIRDFFSSIKKINVMVIGDLILDEYIWGNIDRISPEAPVPVLDSLSENSTLGGAANVANNLISLECGVHLFGVVGNDDKAGRLKAMFKERGIDYSGVITDSIRPTTNKVRIIAHNQQILRIDKENREEISKGIHEKLIKVIVGKISSMNGIILSDYGKGVVTKDLISKVVKEAKKIGIKVLGDPKGRDYEKYKGVNILTPNKKEASLAAGMNLTSESDYNLAANKILKSFGGEALLITRGPEGMSLFQKNKTQVNISTSAKEVYDVTGAGDTVISVFGLTLFAGIEIVDAVKLANIAAGIEVGKVGTSVVTRKEILDFIEGDHSESTGKVINMFELDQVLSRARNKGKTVVFTNGCFDLMHIGHLKYLSKAKSFGDILIIGLNSDSSVRKLKGPKRPLINETERSSLLAALDCVDYVVIFSENTPEKLIKKVRPNVLVKGGDYAIDQVVGRDYVEHIGGRVELVPVVKGMSTSGLVEKILEKYRDQ